MSLVLWIAGGCLLFFLAGYLLLALALGNEGRRLVDRFMRASLATANGDEEQIYLRRSRRPHRQALVYKVPPELDFETDRDDERLPDPPAAWEGENPDA